MSQPVNAAHSGTLRHTPYTAVVKVISDRTPAPRFAPTLRLLGIALLLFVAGCSESTRIDAEWHRRDMVEGMLARWLDVAPTESGFIRTAIDRRWKPLAEQPGYLVEHARLVYAMAIGYEVTKDKRYLDAANGGADFMLTRFRDPVHGGFFQRVAPDGKVIAASKNTYAHAFALFALSHMFRVTGDERYRAAALLTWKEIDASLRDRKGGFYGELPRDFSQSDKAGGDARSQNPLMHLFEALLALHDATQDPAALAGAKSLGDFVVYRLLKGNSDGGAFIPEWYDIEWQPLPTREKGGYIDLGHQFEWSHMLLAAERRGVSGVYGQTAERILKFAIKVGYDESDGGVFTKMYPDGKVDRDKNAWPQTEALRAFIAGAAANNQSDLWRRYEQTVKLVREGFIDRQNGGWYSKQCQRGGCADAQVEPYHMIGMHQAALAVANTQGK